MNKHNLIKYSGPLTKKKKGGLENISWRAVAAIIGAEMAVSHRDEILKEENFHIKEFDESVIEGTFEEIK